MQLRLTKIDFHKERVLITGAHGMVGQALTEILPKTKNIICLPPEELDLRNENKTNEADHIILFI
jgi:dTDP-4-dehydrorhamnose reductase